MCVCVLYTTVGTLNLTVFLRVTVEAGRKKCGFVQSLSLSFTLFLFFIVLSIKSYLQPFVVGLAFVICACLFVCYFRTVGRSHRIFFIDFFCCCIYCWKLLWSFQEWWRLVIPVWKWRFNPIFFCFALNMMIEERYRSMKLLFISDGGKKEGMFVSKTWKRGRFVPLIFIYISVSYSSEFLLVLPQEAMTWRPGGFSLFTVWWLILTRQTNSLISFFSVWFTLFTPTQNVTETLTKLVIIRQTTQILNQSRLTDISFRSRTSDSSVSVRACKVFKD